MKTHFRTVEENEYVNFKKDVQEILSISVIEEFGDNDEEVISDKEIDEVLYNPNVEVYYVYIDEKKVAGVALKIDKSTHHNSIDLLYVYPDCHSKGIGYTVWKGIEEKYPETKVWELVTPYFEKRNINFYVNKCGFKIVEFFNKYHPYPGFNDSDSEFKEDFFRFEKVMK
ncbi:MAG: GNAT family N-acetyltransferase [Clostridium sp.]|uniref:GNAT family N-acetyltransferase n=1 Tax=Clostridium sp. TaxID=1506 RepID=UPI0025C2B099|nr:GNAT family N-acetyltransferase [Clostridium sp.]MCF0147588.1 GNAT family N-acetyltransferase [Clostridium sp.]